MQAGQANRLQQIHQPDREQNAEPAADGREQQALDEEVADDAAARRPERHADPHLRAPHRRARQHQVRDVRARDEQDREHRRHQDAETADHRALRLRWHTHRRLRQDREHARAAVDVRPLGRELAVQARREDVQRPLRRLDAHPVAQAREHQKAAIAPVGRIRADQVARRRQREPQPRAQAAQRAAELGRRHTDHRQRLTLYDDRRTERIGAAAEVRPPQLVADHDHVLRPPGIRFVRREEAADRRLHAQHAEVVGRDDLAHAARAPAVAHHAERLQRIARDIVEDAPRFPHRRDVRVRR